MCFSIPKKISSVKNNIARLEDGHSVKLGNLQVKKGEYVLVFGDIAVEKIPQGRALKGRTIIKHFDELHSSTTKAI